jgi:tRNA-dihydrouridine synthase C
MKSAIDVHEVQCDENGRQINVLRNVPALVLAPMDGVTDAPMRAVMGELGAFTFAVSEFLRVSQEVPPRRVFHRDLPELCHGGQTPSGLSVQVQLLGGDAGRMAEAAFVAYQAGATAIDINFGCPAPTVNRHDGGATLLKYPHRVRDVVSAMRAAVPPEVPVSAKLRLGWDSIDDIYMNAEMAAEGGASWLTIHARTRVAGYTPPVYWQPIRVVRERLGLPVVANGDIFTLEDFRRCREETGCIHYMIGRGALANPLLPRQIADELGLIHHGPQDEPDPHCILIESMRRLVYYLEFYGEASPVRTLSRLKQWLKFAARHGSFTGFDAVKRVETVADLFQGLTTAIED